MPRQANCSPVLTSVHLYVIPNSPLPELLPETISLVHIIFAGIVDNRDCCPEEARPTNGHSSSCLPPRNRFSYRR
ncbi:hypothetical protein MLD38_038460 [Melastoma candidum]|uniref:Uncharacterized protein n=1 Tax=Melastoma candidum TaxID=119954 RepID=A0ACB9KYY2_9MYRT|nr:hypothetical protein MLD38_038460 [Melastoma candidum]